MLRPAPGRALAASVLLLSICYILTSTTIQQVQSQQQALRSPCPRAVAINTNYQYRNSLHFICLQRLANSKPQLDVIHYMSRQTIVSIPSMEMEAAQMASFVDDEGTLRVLVAVPERINGTSMYSIDAKGHYLKEKHTVNTQLVSTMSVWKLELNLEWHLATANRLDVDPRLKEANVGVARHPMPGIGSMITVHSWRMSYFDNYQTITLPFEGHVNKLEPMHINDQEFLIVATESHDPEAGESSRTDSVIYKLDFSDGTLNWVWYQQLGTKHALDVSSFVITHKSSLQRDYYIALVGQAAQNRDVSIQRYGASQQGAPNEHGLIIYKYLGDRFLRTHSIPVPSATKIDTLSYGHEDNHVIIALMFGWSRQISLYLFDGLNLKPMSGPFMPATRPSMQAGPPPPPMNRFQRTINSESFRLFEAPPAPTSFNQQSNSTLKRTLDEELMQAPPMPALLVSSPNDDYSAAEMYGEQAAAAASNETHDGLYQLPINEMIAVDNEERLGQSNAADADPAHMKKRNWVPGGSSKNLLGWCETTIKTILGDNFELAAKSLQSLPRVDQPRPIELYGDLILEGNLQVSNLLYANRITDSMAHSVPVESIDLAPDFWETFGSIARVHSDINQVKQRVDQILVDDGSPQDVYSPLKFEKVIFACMDRVSDQNLSPFMSCPKVGQLQSMYLNGRDINDIQEQAPLSGRSVRISQDVRFEHLVLRGRTSILDSLNGVRIEDIVFKQGNWTGLVSGHKNLRNGLYSSADLIVHKWDKARVDQQTYLTSSGDQRIDADLRLNHVVINSLGQNKSSRIEALNGLQLDLLLNQIAQADGVNQFEVPVAFDELTIQGPTHFSANSLLSSIDIEHVWRSVMFKHLHQNVSAPMDFEGDVHVSYGGDIIVNGLVNGALLAPETVMMRNRHYVLPNAMLFEGELKARLLNVEKHLNGVQVLPNYDTGRKELAILYNQGRQLLTGDKIFNEVRLGGRTTIGGLVNGHLNLTQLYKLVLNNGEPFRFGRVRIKGNDIRIADKVPLHVSSLVNGIKADEICQLANRLGQPMGQSLATYDRLRFEQPVGFNSLRCATINGFNDLRNSFLMKHGEQRVAGTLRLMSGVVFNSTINIGHTFNNLNASSMSQAIEQVISESRTGHKDFYGDLRVDELLAETINELPLSQVFVAKADNAQVISAPMVFDHLDIENVLVVNQDMFTRSYNGLNVSDIIANTLQYDAPQVIYNHVELDHLHILPGANLITKALNDRDLRQVFSDSVLVDLPQQILAPKIFNGQVDFVDRVLLRFGIDGLTEGELKFILLLQSDELIEDDLEFNNDVTIMKSLEIQTGTINDVDVNMFVSSMLSEKRDNALRLRGNSSIRFKDVKLNNLVVTGTIQGLDLSKDALSPGDNRNGTYDSKLREQQVYLTNQRIFNNLFESQQQDFRVKTNYHDEPYSGMCRIHSCPPTTSFATSHKAPQAFGALPSPAMMNTFAPKLPQSIVGPAPPPPQQQQQQQQQQQPPPQSAAPWSSAPRPDGGHPFAHNVWMPQPRPPVSQEHHLMPSPVIMPRPMNMLTTNTTQVGPIWNPQPETFARPNLAKISHEQPGDDYALVDPKYLEYQAMLKAQAISELSTRVNKYLTVSFYYEIVQKHPLLGPVLHAARNPILSEEGNVWLMLKATANKGEPCLQRGQKIDVIAEKRNKGSQPTFTVSSHIQETSNPAHIESLVVGKSHYVFISDNYAEASSETMSQLLVYEWDYPSGMYNLKQKILIDGTPTTLKAFAQNQIGCIVLANPRVVQSNHSGAPLLYCQQAPMSDFNTRSILPLYHIFDLDVLVLPSSGGQIILAALAQQQTEQVGDLIVSSLDLNTVSLKTIALRRTAMPLKLHFVKQHSINRPLLVVSEGITSNDAPAQATTRIFSIDFNPGLNPIGHFQENQIIRDEQFSDIQSVVLDANHSIIFLQSTHSISIYAPLRRTTRAAHNNFPLDCGLQFVLIQRVPTKGANKFLAFNNNLPLNGTISDSLPQSHILALSRDDCEHQRYSTVILKPRFK